MLTGLRAGLVLSSSMRQEWRLASVARRALRKVCLTDTLWKEGEKRGRSNEGKWDYKICHTESWKLAAFLYNTHINSAVARTCWSFSHSSKRASSLETLWQCLEGEPSAWVCSRQVEIMSTRPTNGDLTTKLSQNSFVVSYKSATKKPDSPSLVAACFYQSC